MSWSAEARSAQRLLGAAVALGLAAPAAAQPATPAMRPFESVELRYAVMLPADCRHEEGPGTLEAICTPDLDARRAAELPSAGAFVLEVDGENVPADAKIYDAAAFQAELAESVCGESDATKVMIRGGVQSAMTGAQVFTATVVCPEIKFLALPVRTAEVRTISYPRFRYRLMSRWPGEATPGVRTATAAFFASFRSTAGAAP
jgi:hypothetical protein